MPKSSPSFRLLGEIVFDVGFQIFVPMGFDRNRGVNAGHDGFLVGLGGFQGVDSLAERGAGRAVRFDQRG
jgi:hypothetical protein